MIKDHSVWTKLDRFPPIIVRLLGVQSGCSDEDVVRISGLRLERVKYLSWSPTWDRIPVGEMRAFCEANAVYLDSPNCMRGLTRYLKNDPKFVKLKRHPKYPEFLERLKYLYESSQ